MCAKRRGCVSSELWSRPLPGAGLLECQGPLVSETQLRVASATNTDERGLIPGTGTFLNLYYENMIGCPEFRMAPLQTRLTNRRHQHQQGINLFLTCSVCCTPPFPWSTYVSSARRNVSIHFLLNNQTDALIITILFCYKTLHVSGIFSAHLQEFSTVHSALVSFMQVLMAASKQSQDGTS